MFRYKISHERRWEIVFRNSGAKLTDYRIEVFCRVSNVKFMVGEFSDAPRVYFEVHVQGLVLALYLNPSIKRLAGGMLVVLHKIFLHPFFLLVSLSKVFSCKV